MTNLERCTAALFVITFAPLALSQQFEIVPQKVQLVGTTASQQMLVSSTLDGRRVDLTRKVTWSFESAGKAPIATIDKNGWLRPLRDGKTMLLASLGKRKIRVPVEVSRTKTPPPVSFELEVQPILTAHGCNAGACHGKARGQNGFQLSLLGFDPEFDFNALTKEARGRRLFPAVPQRSLLLRKASGQMPHGGGRRITEIDADYVTLQRWIEQGTPRSLDKEPRLTQVTVSPPQRVFLPGGQQQLMVTAHYSDGTTRDVTRRTTFQSNENAIVGVSKTGLMKAGPIPGEAAIMARYMGEIAIVNTMIPLPGKVPAGTYQQLPVRNFIDRHVWNKLKTLGIVPSQAAPEHKWMRRVYIDLIGRFPTAEEVKKYLADSNPRKRELLIDHLLQRPEYVDHWANKWADLLRPNPYRVGIKTVLNYDAWIRDQFRNNVPYDQFVTRLITARGSTYRNGAVTLYRDRRSPDEVTTLVTQLFLGIRLECAKCHHHPFEKWSQKDFYSFAAYFARVGRKGRGLSPPISGSEEMILVSKRGDVRHPLTNEILPPTPLFGKRPPIGETENGLPVDRREHLARWMTSPDNDYFSQVIVNRIWADLMGRGIVEPVDDLRATNPPSNEPLLKALAAHFRKQKFDIKKLLKTIVSSHVYSLSSLPSERNVSDTRNYSRHYRTRLRAEVLADAVCDITGVDEKYSAMPPGSRATQIWTHRVESLLLDTFGRPDPNKDPPCERTGESTVTQTLHLMNAPKIHAKVISSKGLAARLTKEKLEPHKIIETLYLTVYSRYPDARERQIALEVFQQKGVSPRQATEDLLWAMFNTAEFVFKD